MSASIWNGSQTISSEVDADNTYKFDRVTATEQGQKLFPLSVFSYAPGTGSLDVRINGVGQAPGIDYEETSSNTITILEGVDLGDHVDIRGLIGSTGAASAAVSAAIAEEAATTATVAAEALNTASNTFSATATDIHVMGIGVKVFNIPEGKQFIPGQYVLVVPVADSNMYMSAKIVSYELGVLTLDVATYVGAGEFNNWNIALSGIPEPKLDIFAPYNKLMLAQMYAVSVCF